MIHEFAPESVDPPEYPPPGSTDYLNCIKWFSGLSIKERQVKIMIASFTHIIILLVFISFDWNPSWNPFARCIGNVLETEHF